MALVLLEALVAVEWSAVIPLRCYLLFGCPKVAFKLQVPLDLMMTMELEVEVEVLKEVQLG